VSKPLSHVLLFSAEGRAIRRRYGARCLASEDSSVAGAIAAVDAEAVVCRRFSVVALGKISRYLDEVRSLNNNGSADFSG